MKMLKRKNDFLLAKKRSSWGMSSSTRFFRFLSNKNFKELGLTFAISSSMQDFGHIWGLSGDLARGKFAEIAAKCTAAKSENPRDKKQSQVEKKPKQRSLQAFFSSQNCSWIYCFDPFGNERTVKDFSLSLNSLLLRRRRQNGKFPSDKPDAPKGLPSGSNSAESLARKFWNNPRAKNENSKSSPFNPI